MGVSLHSNKRKSLNQNILWNTTGNIYYLFSQWLFSIIIVRVSGLTSAGVFALAMSLSNIFASIGLYGMRNFQVSDIKNEYSYKEYLYSRYLSIIFSIIICIGFLLLNQGHYSLEKSLIILCYTIFRLSESLFDIYSAFFQKEWRMDIIGKSLYIRGTLNLAVFVLILITTHNLLFSIIAMIITSYLSLIFYDAQNIKHFSFSKNFQFEKVIHLLKQCLPLLGYSLILTIIGSIPRYFLDYYLSEELVGAYNSVATPTVIVQTIALQVFNPFISIFAEAVHQHNHTLFKNTFKKCLYLLLALSLIAILGSVFLGNFALTLLYGDKIIPYTYLLLPLILVTILTSCTWLLSSLITIYHALKELLFINIISLFISLGASFFLIPLYNLQGATFAVALPLVFQLIALTLLLKKYIQRGKVAHENIV